MEKSKNGGSLPYVGLEDISSNTGEFTGSTFPVQVKSDTFHFTPHHVLYGRLRAYLNKVLLPSFEGHCSTEIFPLLPCQELDRNYLFHWLTWSKTCDRIAATATGARMPRANMNEVMGFDIPLPRLDEQKRIVEVLDQAFAALDRARAHAEANLADAVELKNRSVEYELSLDALGQPEFVGPHVDLLTGFAFKSAAYSDAPDDIRLIRGDNIVQGAFRWDGVKRWSIDDRKTHEEYELALNDVLIAMDRTWISAGIKYAIVDETALPSLLVQRVARLRAEQSVAPRYLGYWVGSTMFEKYVLSIQTGLGVPHVSGKQIENFPIRVPSVASQAAVVDRLDAIVERCGDLISIYQQRLADLTNLRQSLLQKAFSGELT